VSFLNDLTRFIVDIPIPNNQLKYEIKDNYFYNSHGKYKLAIRGDSFSFNLLYYLGNTFKQVRHFQRGDLTAEDLEYIKNSDIFIFEMAERGIQFLPKQKFPEEN
jgi:hypothetical protein